jgi:hypothetical protein
MGVKKVDLLLELIIRGPIIIALEKGHVLAPARTNCFQIVSHSAYPLLPEEKRNSIGIAPMIVHNYGPCAIGRTVLSDDNLVFEIHSLGKYALDCLRDESLMVICDQGHA